MKVMLELDTSSVKTAFAKIKKALADLSSPMRDISLLMKEAVMNNFEDEGNPTRWKALAESTRRAKMIKYGPGKQILEGSGWLKQSINASSTANEAAVYTGVFYGVYHQTGTRRMPQRAFMPFASGGENIPPFDEESITNIKAVLNEYLSKAVG